MLKNKKTVLILGIAVAYLAYRYSKLNEDEKTALKEKGRKILEDYLPEDIKGILMSHADTDK